MHDSFLRFLNIEYWYCIFYSIFGGRCTATEEVTIVVNATSTPGGFFGFLVNAGGGIMGALALAAAFLAPLWAVYSSIAYTLSGTLALALLSMLGGLVFLRYSELSTYGRLPPESADAHRMRGRWDALLAGAMLNNPVIWRESIASADELLGELLGSLGYVGEDTDDRLRTVPEGAFVTLPAAWEAHRVRNFIVHPSSDFILTQHEAFRVMKLYEQVFEEFKFV